jgi:ADP-ribose pyrophosphatase
MPPPWKKHGTELVGSYKIFELTRERFQSPRTGATVDAVVLTAPDWVNVVAFTAKGAALMIRQYRFGTERVTLEIVGGMVDAGESPLQAARRELREETGYDSERWTSLGSVAPNPAFLRNRLHTFLAEGCVRVSDQAQDPGEDIEVVLIAASEVDAWIAGGAVDHALVLAAFEKLALYRAGRQPQ